MKRKPKYVLATHKQTGEQYLVSYKTEDRIIDKLGLDYFSCELARVSPDAVKGVKSLLAAGKRVPV